MRRVLTVLATAMLLVTILPGTVSGARVTKYHDHGVGFFCEGPVAGGFANISINTSTAFGDSAGADVWLDPAVPFVEPPSISGSTDTVQLAEGTSEVSFSATFDVIDPAGARLGSAVLESTMTRVGDPQPIIPTSLGNHHSNTSGTDQRLEGDATLTVNGGGALTLTGCSGDITDVSVLEANPNSLVDKDTGVSIDCRWQTVDSSASFFAIQDKFGFSSFSSLATADLNLFDTGGTTGLLTASTLNASIALTDQATGDPYSAVATATLTATGGPVTSTLLSATVRRKLIEQALVPVGQLTFSTGASFDFDQAHCRTASFSRQTIATNQLGPKPGGAAPANDAPSGAFLVKAGTKLTAQTGAASAQAEVQVGATCPEGVGDEMGRTLWYKVTGTGAPLTFDTAGSNFDTVIGVFKRDGADFTELACNDDVIYQPVGSTFQAALTFDTVAGQTYYVEVGGFQSFFNPDNPEYGLLKLKVS